MAQGRLIRRVRRGEMPPEEARDGYIALAMLLVLVWRLAFHPRVALEAEQIALCWHRERRQRRMSNRQDQSAMGSTGGVSS